MLPSMNLNHVIDQVSRDKGIKREVLIDTLESAILTAAKKVFGSQRELEAQFNATTGVVELYQIMEVVEEVIDPFRHVDAATAAKADDSAELGDELGFQIYYRDEDVDAEKEQQEKFGDILLIAKELKGFGRIAAQTAKQVIIQRVREAERENVYNEYKDRKGELITGIARRFERGNIIVDLGRVEAILPLREQTPRETYRPGDRVQAFVLDVQRSGKGPQIILSRTNVGLLLKLFEMEVPEIYEGIVRIESAAREPGGRSKIAVGSRDSDVDPVGACVGMKGSRVQAVVQELRGEKIDIIPFDRDPVRFVINAIQPAEVVKVVMDEENGTMELVVPDDQQSLAIGKKGQNVRLAAKLTGWKLDIISETKALELEQRTRETMLGIEGMSDDLVEDFFRLGYTSLEVIAETEPSELANIPGLSADDARRIVLACREILEKKAADDDSAESPEAPLSERERLLRVRGIGEKTLESLARGGYTTVESLITADDEGLAITSGLGIRKARVIKQAAQAFLEGRTFIPLAGEGDEDEADVQAEVPEVVNPQDQGPGDSAG
ncbi:MAG: transcription termination factor NusA [Myxococcota bacterium]|jgi:N utilization substance protein A|nr:transcription termination factor NusA [Myxococcota bacterium]